ncbi:MAG: ribonuclease III [bacterium]|nr:MAG: ribonuclease III [bacterium]KAF0149110.1 MAG: ribonuclease III [bacterium]KAF0168398.1 MAG: ribonuclease III [bacterium]TXT20365.1 MAG: ribonuclease III [bacterium]
MPADIEGLEALLGHSWAKRELLLQALTHRSFGARNYERLEFLGDGVLNCVVGLMLYRRFPELPEGRLSRLRANLVNQDSLHAIAHDLDLGRHLRLGEGELKSGGAQRPSILADALEALLGAALLDAGFGAAQGMVERLFDDALDAIDPEQQGKDAKTRLQEWLQPRRLGLPAYTLTDTAGQAHAQTFHVECRIDPLKLVTRGQGASRKAAEQMAAEAALRALEESAGRRRTPDNQA